MPPLTVTCMFLPSIVMVQAAMRSSISLTLATGPVLHPAGF